MGKLSAWILILFFSATVAVGQSPTPTPPPNGPGGPVQGGPRKITPHCDPGERGLSAGSAQQSDASPDARSVNIENTIQSTIQKDPALSAADITVDVKNGKQVLLNGTVPSKDAKDMAERIAKENSNGMKVKNHLKVVSADNKAKESGKSKDNKSNPK